MSSKSNRSGQAPIDPEELLPDESVLRFEDYMAMQRTIGEPNRFRILYVLKHGGEMSASELADATELAQNNLHHHLNRLVDVGLVVNRKQKTRDSDGLYSYYDASALGRAMLEDGIESLMRREWDLKETYSS